MMAPYPMLGGIPGAAFTAMMPRGGYGSGRGRGSYRGGRGGGRGGRGTPRLS